MTGRGRTEPVSDPPGQREHTAPDLSFTVTGADAERFAAVPALRFHVAISRIGGGPIRSITLTTAIRIAPARRRYDEAERGLLAELFGEPRRWGTTMRPLLWTRTTTVVPPFDESTVEDVPVACGHDVELAVTKYLHAVRDGDIPLDFLFSGTIFYVGGDGRLATAQISWSADTTFRLPVQLWHELMNGRSEWVQLSKESFARLYAYKSRHALLSWDDTVESLLAHSADREEPGSSPVSEQAE